MSEIDLEDMNVQRVTITQRSLVMKLMQLDQRYVTFFPVCIYIIILLSQYYQYLNTMLINKRNYI